MEEILSQIKHARNTDDLCLLLDQAEILPDIERITILLTIIDILISKQDYESCSGIYVELISISNSYIYWIEYLHFLKVFSTVEKFKDAFKLGISNCDSPQMLYDVYCRAMRLNNDISELFRATEEYNNLVTIKRKRKHDDSDVAPPQQLDRQTNLNKTIVVKNYNLLEDNQAFKDHFGKFGKIIRLIKHDEDTIFVEYAANASVGNVREIKQHSFENTQLYIQIPHGARDRTLYLSGLPTTVTEAEIRQYLSQFGTVDDIRIKTNFETGTSFVYADMYSSNEAKKACTVPIFELNNNKVHITMSDPKKARSKYQIATDKERNCCIKNLPYWVNASTQSSLEKILAPFGTILQIRFLHNHKGMAFVEFENANDCQTLINTMDEIKLGGRVLKIEGILNK